jgi:hypothetical protein
MACILMHDFCHESFYFIQNHLNKNWRYNFSDVVTRIANKIKYNIERIDELLNDGLKDLMIVIKIPSSKEKLNVSAETDSKQNQGFDLAVKLRSVIGFRHNPIDLIHKRLSQLQDSLANYINFYNTKSRQAFRYKQHISVQPHNKQGIQVNPRCHDACTFYTSSQTKITAK